MPCCRLLSQARRHNEALSLICVEIDRLVGIQELMGCAVADRLVQSVGETVAVLIRSSDIVARLDDDRIVAVLPRAPRGGALDVAQKICEAVAEKTHVGYEMGKITASIGIATFPTCATMCTRCSTPLTSHWPVRKARAEIALRRATLRGAAPDHAAPKSP